VEAYIDSLLGFTFMNKFVEHQAKGLLLNMIYQCKMWIDLIWIDVGHG
jgi:hypothetical protein